MASYLDKAQINSAITDNTKLDLSHQQITTTDIMQLNVSYIHEMVPGEKIDVQMESFARLNPMPVPTFGRMSMRHRAFFVPMRTIFPKWHDFITDTPHVNADGYTGAPLEIPNTVPLVTNKTLAEAFLNNSGTDASSDPNAMVYPTPTGTTPDITSTGTSSTWIGKYNFTTTGRVAIKMLEALGYKINWKETDTTSYNALPIIALAKIYSDWYFPQQYSNLDLYDRISYIAKWDASNDYVMSHLDVWYILKICAWVCFDSDYFVSAWDTPNQPNAGNYSDFKLVNIDTARVIGFAGSNGNFTNQSSGIDVNGVVTNGANSSYVNGGIYSADAPFIAPFTPRAGSSEKSTVTPISEYLLHSLHALTDYMKRHQLAGSRAFDRYLARFGKALPAEKMNRTNYLGAHMQDIQIGDIMSTADTDGANLGKFAGKGLSYGDGKFDFQTDEFGYFIILTSIVPNTGYFQGVDRQVKRITKLSYFTPEFDSLGSQPITADELFIPQDGTVMTGDSHEQIFGFTPRYADYKVAHDQLLGNFRLNSINAGNDVVNAADSWHLMRVFNAASFSGNYSNAVHSPNFIYGWNNAPQWKRLFYYQEADAPDNFTVIHNFNIAAYTPMKALYDSYEFEDKGKKVTLDANGVKMN